MGQLLLTSGCVQICASNVLITSKYLSVYRLSLMTLPGISTQSKTLNNYIHASQHVRFCPLHVTRFTNSSVAVLLDAIPQSVAKGLIQKV